MGERVSATGGSKAVKDGVGSGGGGKKEGGGDPEDDAGTFYDALKVSPTTLSTGCGCGVALSRV